MITFSFADKDSYGDFSLVVTKRPIISSPVRRVSYVDIPGKNSSLRYDEETYEDITVSVECTVKGSRIAWQIDDIKSWLLLSGERDLIFSFQSTRKYRAQVVNSIDFEQVFGIASKFIIIFNCRPFKYSVSNNTLTFENSSGWAVTYPSELYSEPLLTVYCTGSGTFKIKNHEMILTDIDREFIVINSELEEAYFIEDGENINANTYVEGEFPIIEPGSNSVSFTGDITKIEIISNLRWL
jgi:predicted phage tail component-like protein